MVGSSNQTDINIIRVLSIKYFLDVLKSPGLLGCCLFPVLFLALFKVIVQNDIGHEDTLGGLMGIGLIFSSAMIPGTATVYPMAEAREKHLLRTLLLAGVRRRHMMMARFLASMAYVLLAGAMCYLLTGGPAEGLLLYLLLIVAAGVPMTSLSLLLGLASRNQMAANFSVLPIVLIGIAPMLLVASPELFSALPLLPTGGSLMLVIMQGTEMLSLDAVLQPGIGQLLWVAASLAMLVIIAPRIPRDE